jgi:hypothetical protein
MGAYDIPMKASVYEVLQATQPALVARAWKNEPKATGWRLWCGSSDDHRFRCVQTITRKGKTLDRRTLWMEVILNSAHVHTRIGSNYGGTVVLDSRVIEVYTSATEGQ